MRDVKRFAPRVAAWTILAACLIPFLCNAGWAGVSELDPEGVFCAYYYVCGEIPERSDIEDLCWALESPTFSAFKPAEMFSGNSLRKVRSRLHERIRQLNANSLFRWDVEGYLHPKSRDRARFQPVTRKPAFPQATPYIEAEVAPEQWQRLREALNDLPLKIPEGPSRRESRVSVLLKPHKVEKRFQKRNIAHEDVFLPIRCVVFVPVAIQPPTDLSEGVIRITR